MIILKIMEKFFDEIADGKRDKTIRIYDSEKFDKIKIGDEVCLTAVTDKLRRKMISGTRMILKIKNYKMSAKEFLSEKENAELLEAYGEKFEKYLGSLIEIEFEK